jgi:hypothetical protein
MFEANSDNHFPGISSTPLAIDSIMHCVSLDMCESGWLDAEAHAPADDAPVIDCNCPFALSIVYTQPSAMGSGGALLFAGTFTLTTK